MAFYSFPTCKSGNQALVCGLIHDILEDLGSLFFVFCHVCAPFLRSLCPRWGLELLPSYLHISPQPVDTGKVGLAPLSGSFPHRLPCPFHWPDLAVRKILETTMFQSSICWEGGTGHSRANISSVRLVGWCEICPERPRKWDPFLYIIYVAAHLQLVPSF